MSSLSGLIELIAVCGAFIAVALVYGAPMMFAQWAGDRRQKLEDDIVRQAEIARKVAIAEAAAEARRRGEPFVPPADYDR